MPFIEESNEGDLIWHPWQIIALVTGIVIVCYALSWIAFGANVATAGIIGKGQAHIQQQSAGNRIFQQARFVDDFGSIQKFDQQYKNALQALAAWDTANAGKLDNGIGTLANQRQNLFLTAQGIQQQCQNVITDYDNAGSEYLAQDFRSNNLPDTVGIQSYCQETYTAPAVPPAK